MDRRKRPRVAADHRLDHVQRLAAADLAHDDPVGPHAERVDEQLPHVQPAAAVAVGLLGLQVQAMLLDQPQLGRVLDNDDPLFFGNEPRNGAQEDRFARAGAAGDDDVLPQPHADIHKLLGRRAKAAEGDQVVHRRGPAW